MQLYFYADGESVTLLASAQPKALLIGGDFGYGNFGDVLQHIGSARHVKAWSQLATVSVFALNALSRHVDAGTLRKSYAVDALLFVTEAPMAGPEAERLGLHLVRSVGNISFVHLYGGGYLNEMWGDFVLGVVEHFLERLPDVPYVMSGQQLSLGYVKKARAHVEKFRPRLMGMRDMVSLERGLSGGMQAEFSFDDAVEPLLALRDRLELREGDGAFIHLNTSGYTGNGDDLSEMLIHLRGVAAHLGDQGRAVLLQAFQDAREEVLDSIETVKRLETGFPFSDIEIALLVRAILSGAPCEPRVLQGRFGYSSSYHVTLWLQLHGIPCWLRGSNDYYTQKRGALDIDEQFEDFLKHMRCPDHSDNLRRRMRWLSMLQQVLESIRPVANRIEWTLPDDTIRPGEFHFKGEPRLEDRLNETWATVAGFREDNERLNAQINNVQDAVDELEHMKVERDSLKGRLQESGLELAEVQSQFDEARGMMNGVAIELERRIAEHSAVSAQLLETAGEVAALKAEVQHKVDAASAQLVAVKAESDSLLRELSSAKKRETYLISRINGLSEQVTVLGATAHDLDKRAREAEAAWYAACQGNEQLSASLAHAMSGKDHAEREVTAMESRLAAYSEQLTVIGGEAREFRVKAEWGHARLQEVTEREQAFASRLQEVLKSRSWRWTRPLRVFNRYLHTGSFDPAGKAGLFEASRVIGKKLPLPKPWISSIGRFLRRMRRG